MAADVCVQYRVYAQADLLGRVSAKVDLKRKKVTSGTGFEPAPLLTTPWLDKPIIMGIVMIKRATNYTTQTGDIL